jgi:PIN domain nuclease of toxin-antitoxin system
MSAFLLDTHVWLWYAEGVTERLLPAGVRNRVALATRDERIFEYAKQGFLRVVSV